MFAAANDPVFAAAPAAPAVVAFVPGTTYQTRSLCDYDCIYSVTVTRRTAKSVWFKYHGKEKRAKISNYDGVESFKPFGSYSMAPTIRANKKIA
jgi:hypothetical protein